MAKGLKILAVCGFGIGTSLILRMTIEKALKSKDVKAEVINADITTGPSIDCNIVFTSKELAPLLREKMSAHIIEINNFMSKEEVLDKGWDIINEYC